MQRRRLAAIATPCAGFGFFKWRVKPFSQCIIFTPVFHINNDACFGLLVA